MVFGCAAACSLGQHWQGADPSGGGLRLQACLCSFQLSFPPPEFITHFIRVGTRFAVGMNSWGWSSGIWLLFLAAAWVCAASEGLHNQPLVYFCTDRPFRLSSYGVHIFQNLFSLSAFIRSIAYRCNAFSTTASLDEIALVFSPDACYVSKGSILLVLGNQELMAMEKWEKGNPCWHFRSHWRLEGLESFKPKCCCIVFCAYLKFGALMKIVYK